MAFSFSLGDFFPLPGSRRAAQLAATPPSHRGRRKAAAERARPARRFGIELIEPRLLLSADGVIAGFTGALTHGLDAVGSEIDDLLTGNPLLDKYVPGIVEARTVGDDTREVSPTIGEALSISFDVSTTYNGSAFDFDPAGKTLAQRYEYLTSPSLDVVYNFSGDAAGDEASLKAIDIDGDGQVAVDEAFEVFFAGRLQSFLEDVNAADTADLADEISAFLDPLFGSTVPTRLTDRVDVDIDDVSWTIRHDALTFEADVSVALIQADRFDLGYEADKLGILPDPGTPPQPNGDPFKVAVSRSVDFGSLQFGFVGIGDAAVANADFFFAAPDRASDPNDGVRIGLSIDNGGDPVAPKDGASFIAVNVGFLGAHFIDPNGGDPGQGGMLLDMALVGAAADPSNASALGFTDTAGTGTQGVAMSSGVVEADTTPDTATLALTPIQFVLTVGNDADNPGTELTLPTDSYADTAAIVTALNTALAGSALAGIVTATDNDADDRIEFRLVASDPTPLGFLAEQSSPGALVADSDVSGLIGVGKAPFVVSFLLSVDHQVRLVTVNVTVDADGADNLSGNPADDADNDAITITSLVADLQAGLNAAGFDVAPTAGNNGNTLTISGSGTIEISHTLTLDTLERITLAELEGPSQIFDMAVDGDAVFSLDLAVRADTGLEDGETPVDDDYRPEGTIKLTLDPFDGNDVKGVVVDTVPGTSMPVVRASFGLTDAGGVALRGGASDMQDLLDFNVINVADMLGTFAEIGTWFERLSGTDLLQGFDLPFADTVLGDLLNFRDLITDTFLIDDLDDGLQADTVISPKLLDWVSIGGAEKKLVALFGTAQQLADELNGLLNPLDVAATAFLDGEGRRNLSYTISVADIALDVVPDVDGAQPLVVPLDFEIDLAPFANFQTGGELEITADGSIGFTLGVILGDAVDALDDNGPDSTPLGTLNSGAGVLLNTNLALSTTGAIKPLVGRLSGNAVFTVTLKEAGVETAYEVTLSKAQTIDNEVLLDPDPLADNPTSLIDDLNDSLAAAGLGTKLRAVAEPIQGDTASARILLVAIAPGITRFQTTVSSGNVAYTELGLRSQSASTASIVAPEAPDGANPAEVKFALTIYRTGDPVGDAQALTLTDGATDDNVSLQSLVNDLDEILPDGIVASQSGGRLVLSAIDSDIESFSVVDTSNLSALGFTLGVLTDELSDLNVGTLPTALVAGPVLRGGAAPGDPFGRLAAPVGFTVDLGDGNGVQSVDIAVAAAANNVSTHDLVRNLNTAFEVNVAGLIAALNEGGRIVLRAIDPSVTAITVAGLSGDEPAALGLADGSSAPLAVRSALNAPVSYGVSEDVEFTVTINGDADVATLTRENTITNRSLYDLAASLNNAINAAVGGFNSNPLVATVQSGQIVIGLKTSGSSTNLIGDPAASLPGGGVAPADVDDFSISSADTEVRDQLKLVSALNVANEASNVDFVIHFRDGNKAQVTLDSLDTNGDRKLDGTLEDLIDAIETAPGAAGKISVETNTDGTSLKLTDLTAGGELFRVVAVNGSPAAAQLGILGSDISQLNVGEVPVGTAAPDGVIDGGKIATIELRDRIYLSDVSASAEITVASGADPLSAEATFGFAGVRLSMPASTTLFEATAELPILDAPITLRDLFDTLGNPANPLDLSALQALLAGGPTLTLLADITMDVETFPDASALIGGAGSATVSLRTNDDGDDDAEQITLALADLVAAPGSFPDLGFIVVENNFGDLLKFQDIEFDDVIGALQAIADFLRQFEAFDFLGDQIPVIGLSVNDLIGLADEFQAAVDDFHDNPAGGIQALGQKVLEGLGLPSFTGGGALQQMQDYFRNIGIPDADIPPALTQLIQFAIAGDILRFDLRLPVGFNRGLSVDLDLGEALGASLGPVEIQGGANLAASGYFDARLAFGIDLSDPTRLVIYDDDTGIFAGLAAGAQNVQFNAAIGPLGVFVKDGAVSLDLSADVNVDDGQATPVTIALVGAPGVGEVSLADFLDTLQASLSGSVAATLPIYVPTDSDYLDDLTFSAGFALSVGNGLELTAPDLQVPDLSGIDLSSLNPFDSIPQMLDALDFFLMGLQDIMDGEVFAIELPLIGDQLQGAADFIEDLRRDVLSPIRTYAEQAPELGLELVQKLLYSLLGPGSAGVLIDDPLNPGNDVDLSDFLGLAGDYAGLDLLKDYDTADGETLVTFEDIVASNDGSSNFEWLFRLGQTFTPSVDIDFDLGIPAIAFAMDVGLDVVLDWDLALGLGIGTADGAYIFIGDHRQQGNSADDDELMLTVSVDIAQDSEILGSLGFLQLEISEGGDQPGYGDDPGLEHDGTGPAPAIPFGSLRNTFIAAQFGVDLINGSAPTDTRLSFSELGNLTAEVSIEAEAEVNLDLTARFNPAILPDAISALLPEVSARFVLDWETGDITADDFDFASSLTLLGFRDVEVDMGSFISDFLGPFVEKIAEVTGPLQPIIDVITAPIPVVSDLAGQPISLVDIAGMTGYVEPAMIYAIADIITLVNDIGDGSKYGDFAVPLGDFMFIGAAGSDLISGTALMTAGYSLKNDSQFDEANLAAAVDQQRAPGDPLGAFGSLLSGGSGDADSSSLVSGLSAGTAAGSSGFEFPLFDDPALIFGLLLGKDIPLITYDLAPFGMDFSYTQKFPVWDALFVRIGGSVGLTIDLAFGYDTAGVREFAEGGFSNPLDLLGGLYVSDTNQASGEGVDVPELILKGELFAGAELNLGIASAGADGLIGLVVNFDLYDPDSDGKVRVDELLGNFLYEFNYGTPPLAPIAIFDVTGQVYAQLRAFVEALFFKYEFEITPPITLFEFEIPFEREPFLATERGDGSLLLNIGPNAAQRLNGDTRDIDETVIVRSLSDTEVEVWNGTTIRESDAQRYRVDPAKGIIGFGGSGNDTIDLSQVTHAIVYQIEGGVGDDTLLGTAGGGSMMGGLGNDTMTGGAGVDYAYGGDGNDTIDGAGGNDFLFGDTGIVRALSDESYDPDFDADDIEQPFGDRIRSFVGAKDGDDRIFGGDGLDVILGGGGNDYIEGGADADIVLGDGGNFDRQAGNLIRIDATDPNSRYDVNARGAGGKDTILGNGGNDVLFGGASDDLIDGGADDDEIEAGAGFDTAYGGSGADLVYGGADADILFGFRDPQGAFFGQPGEVGDGALDGVDTIFGEEGNDFIRGNGDNDFLYGGAGADILFGDEGDDEVYGEAGGDIAFGGADDDFVDGSDGADILFGDDGLVVYFDFTADASPAFNVIGSRIRFVDGADGDGNLDQLIGDSAESLRDSSIAAADDIATSRDVILTATLPTDGSDTVIGGDGRDIVFGGGSDGPGGDLTDTEFDTLYGDFDPNVPFNGPRPNGQDVMVGDGGRVELFGRRYLRAASESGPEDGKDVMSGNDAGDFMFGGGFSDEMHGFEPESIGNLPLDGVEDNDVMLGDHGEILFDEAEIPNRIEIVRTTYAGGADTGRSDLMFGTFGNDVMFGGLNGSSDVMEGGLGQDILLGDQGAIYFHDDPLTPEVEGDSDLDTLDLIRSFVDGLGGSDVVSGGEDSDVLIGGTAGDTMYGDNAAADSGAADGEDIMLGDNADVWLIGTVGRLTVRVAAMTQGTAVDLITTTDLDDNHGGPDTMTGNAGADIVFGGVNAGLAVVAGPVAFGEDVLYGDQAVPTPASIALDADDILVGDNGLLDFTYETDTDRNTLDLIHSEEDGSGGVDIISGNKGADVAIGGTDGDVIYGDDDAASAGTADGSDALLGDNADIFLVDVGGDTGADLRLVLGSAVALIRTTDEEHPEYGGEDTISGNAQGDIIAGGVQGDLLYGDAAAPVDGLDGNDVMLGDNAALEWLSDGRLAEIKGIDIAANNPALWAKYGTTAADDDLGTLDLITTEQPTNGARDVMFGNAAGDIMAGGTDVDEMHGSAGADAMFGDHARLYPQFSFVQVGTTLVASPTFSSRNYFAIDTGALDGGQGDRMWGDAGDDVMLGQQGDDRMWGGDDDDDMIGGHNVSGTYAAVVQAAAGIAIDEFAGVVAAKLQSPDNFMNDAMDGGAGDDAMTGDNAIVWRRGDDLSPRFRLLTAPAIYTTDADTITANIGATAQSDPEDADGRDIQLVDHADDTVAGLFGWDVMAGGADNDVMYGQLGDDLMQGDGSIAAAPAVPPWVVRQIDVTDSAGPTAETLYFNVPEDATDGDDYMEGNGGRDLMYGGLGQDDMIGGSSALFGLNGDLLLGLTDEQMRPDDSDTMFGGAGVRIARNDLGMASLSGLVADGSSNHVVVDDAGHARDADFMMGDNANVYRLVAPVGDAFLTFNYDDYAGGLRIVPRAMQQLDYTLGGGDHAGGGYNADGQATPTGEPVDNGAADLMHGEAGDDIVFGMTGSDVMFGEGQNDDLIGGYGHDWMSGGTGQDGMLGDDGLIGTSRNSTTGEPLYGVAGLLAGDASTKYSNGDALDELITTPGNIQSAIINKSGALKKTVDLVPFSFDPAWIARDDEFPDNADGTPFADDIVFGGWGSDWMHGGSGDDALSGAEALDDAYVPTYNVDGVANGRLDLGYDSVGIASALVVNPTTQNPGNVLFFHPEDADGQHLNNRFRAGEFDLYDEYNPRAKILLDATGVAVLDGSGVDFLLNFDRDEAVLRPAGNVPKATGQQTESYPEVRDDGADAIFGDLGNDWVVGGTGRDNLYGGWGNDLLQADDDLDTDTLPSGPHAGPDLPFDNEAPDTHPTYEDRAYGGAGRDVIIGNTGGDRLIDWVGEYNSYIVPYAPFGQASVSRTLQPFLPEFLYALSAGDGADPTRYTDAIGAVIPQPTNNNPNPSRNGEPHGELGLVLQKDFAWGDQTGAPADPQAGNIPGGPRDVLRSADFAGNNANAFVAASGSWTVANNVYEVAPSPTDSNTDAISLFNADVTLPSYFEITATINAVKPIAGFKGNAYMVFDYYGADDFKFAGINISTNKLEIGRRAPWGFQVLATTNMSLKADLDYNVLVAVNGSAVTLVVDNSKSVSYAFSPRMDADGVTTYGINAGMYGLGADNGRARIDNVVVQRVPPKVTLTLTDAFAGAASTLLFPDGAGWVQQSGRLTGAPPSGAPFATATNGIAVSASSLLKLDTTLATSGIGGIVFDMYSPTDFKWAAVDRTSSQVLLGHHTARSGWVVDAAAPRAIGAGDSALSVSLRGTTASVSLNGQAVLSHVYNGNVVDGAVGIVSRSGSSSFDSFTLQTDDARFAPSAAQGASLVAASADGAGASTTQALTPAQLDALVTEAASRWRSAQDGPRTPALDALEVSLADLPGEQLATYLGGGRILVDIDAAGAGWFVDPTPGDDREYRQAGSLLIARPRSDAGDRMDLLSALMHEMGHAIGIDHAHDGVMAPQLGLGTRVDPAHSASASASPGRASPSAAAPAWQIDWQRPLPGRDRADDARHPAAQRAPEQAPAADWRQRFVNHLGQGPERLDPNARLRVFVPVVAAPTVAATSKVSLL